MALQVLPTRYGAAAVDALADAVAEAKAGEPLRPVTVVVPSNYAGVAARRALARRRGIAGVSFVTLYRLAELLAGASLATAGRVPVSSPVLATAFRGALAADPGLFGPVADEPSTVEALRRVHRELRELSEADLSRLAAGDARARAVVRIDREVTAHLRSRWYDETDLMAVATERVRDGIAAAADADHVIVHLPQRLTASGAELLSAVAYRGRVTVLLGVTENAAADAAHEHLLTRLGLADVPRPGAASPIGTRVELVVAADEDDEVRTALRRVLGAAAEGIPFERMLVVYGPGAGYGRMLVDHLTAARVPWNGVADAPLDERLAGRSLLGLLALDASTLRRHDVFALLASSPPMPDRPIASWERLAREAGVVGGRDQWEERLGALGRELRARGAASTQDPPWQLAQADRVDGLRTFVAALAERLDPPDQATWAAHARWARRLLELVLGGPARRGTWSRDEQRAAERVDSILERLGRLDAVADPRGGTRAGSDTAAPAVERRVFQAALEAEMADGLTTLGRLGEGLFIGPVSLAVGIDADVVIVLGLVEGCLPGGLGDDPLLSDATRRTLVGSLPTASERRQRLHHQLLAVAGAAATAVVAARPRADLRSGRARYASRWVVDMCALAPQGPSHRHRSFHSGLHDALPPASEQEALLADLHLLALAHLPPNLHPSATADAAMRHTLALVGARASERFTAFDGNLAKLAAAGVDLRPRQPTSASALETWADCPFAYFIRHLLGVRELDIPEEDVSMRPADRGILVHAVLDAVIARRIAAGDVPVPGEAWSPAAQEELADELRACCAETESRGVVGHPLHWRLEQRRLRRRLDAFLSLDARARGELGVSPAATEMAFGYDIPFAIALPDGGSIALAGKVDRVDDSPGRVAVIDYKTGRARSPWQSDPFTGGVRLQLPIYGLAARAHLGRPQAEVAAEYWHLDDQVRGRVRRHIDVDEGTLARLPVVLATIANAMAAGVFAPRPDEPNPWRRSRCPCCDPDGADTATLWAQSLSKRGDPGLADYLRLVEGPLDPDADGVAP